MKAMILAAGTGTRMLPLTLNTPKPLLQVGDKPLIEHHINHLVDNGFTEIVINTSYLRHMIEDHLSDGSQLGCTIQYSKEVPPALETGGGINKALTLLGKEPFIVVNGDVWCDYPYANLRGIELSNNLCHLILVKNPEHNSAGDFALSGNRVIQEGDSKRTFSGIGLYSPKLFANCPNEAFPLGPLLRQAMDNKMVSGEIYSGTWFDIGTPERLNELNKIIY